jgi:hypothetical protein
VQGAFRIQEMQITATAKVWATNHIREARRAQKSCNIIVKQNRADIQKCKILKTQRNKSTKHTQQTQQTQQTQRNKSRKKRDQRRM